MAETALTAMYEYFQTEYILPVGSGSAGILLALQLLERGRSRVIVPAACCPSIAVAVLAADAMPVPVDIQEKDFTLSSPAAAAALTDDTGAILAVDSFGCPADLAALRQATNRRPLLLIEDACQAYGGTDGQQRLGQRGDIGVISFGYSKPLDLGGGGLLISHSREIHDELRARAGNAAATFSAKWKNRLAVKLMKTDSYRLLTLLGRRLGLLRYPFPPRLLNELGRRWPIFVSEITPMQSIFSQIAELVATIPGVRPLDSDSVSWLPWRFSFTVAAANRAGIVAAMHHHGIRTSQLYRPLEEFFHFPVSPPCPLARQVTDEIVNLVCPSQVQALSSLRNQLRSLLSANPPNMAPPRESIK
jgi:hypothetical protein